ncbi:MAG: hypothetical protein V4546_05835 [Bacteroidota bacterium]
MQHDKKTVPPQKDFKIVSRPSNEELDDQIIDEENLNHPKNKPLKQIPKTDFGEGIED